MYRPIRLSSLCCLLFFVPIFVSFSPTLAATPTENFDALFKPPDVFIEEVNVYAQATIKEYAALIISVSIAGYFLHSFKK